MTRKPIEEIPGCREQVCEVRPVSDGGDGGFELLNASGEVCASGPSARWLSHSALMCSFAKRVDFNFDLGLLEDE